MLNDMILDRLATEDLNRVKGLEPARRVAALLELVRKRPDHIPTAGMLLVALRNSKFLEPRAEATKSSPVANPIPLRISQFWDDPSPPQDLLSLSRTWQDVNPAYQHRIFNERTALIYLAERFPQAVAAAYRRCGDATTKADLFRLAVLTAEGGIWADMDDRCNAPISRLIPKSAEAFFWQESTGHLCNNLLGARPEHPILRRALVTAVNAINRGDRDKVWMLTGPGLLSRAFAAEPAASGASWQDVLGQVAVLDESEIWPCVAIHCRTSHKRLGKHWSKTTFEQSKDLGCHQRRVAAVA
jgi:mannosyltransferase OCH1-like enzyme